MFDFSENLRKRLQEPLPGDLARQNMAPTPVSGKKPNVKPHKESRKSAVLVLLLPPSSGYMPDLLLTVRNKNLGHHAGQISFPGGMIEPGETGIQAALRETQEEVGIDSEKINILGVLSELYVAPSDNLILPVIGVINFRPKLHLQQNEVEQAFTVPVTTLMDQKYLEIETWNIRDYTLQVPYWNIHEVPLWGATAMMCAELVEVLKDCFE